MKRYSLVKKLVAREVQSRYQGSVLGLAWTLINPAIMLVIYTIVFSEVFKMRWGGDDENKMMFAIMVFSGMLVLTFFSEVLSRAPTLILHHVNFVKKVVFPLEVLPVVSVGVALFQMMVSIVFLLLVLIVMQGYLHVSILFLPVILIPLMLLSLGLSLFLAAIGVYFRDAGELIRAVVTVLMFLSPVFYPMSAVPASLKPIVLLNPLTFVIQQVRAVIIWGEQPNWEGLAIYTMVAILCLWLGYVFFQKVRQGFADVI